MGSVIRGLRNVMRNPLRLVLVVGVLGASLMFVATMVDLNGKAQQQLAQAYAEIGTGMDIVMPMSSSMQPASPSGVSVSNDSGEPERVPAELVKQIEEVPGVVRVEESLTMPGEDEATTLDGTQLVAKSPGAIMADSNGNVTKSGEEAEMPVMLSGVSPEAVHFVPDIGGEEAEIVEGRRFTEEDNGQNVALMAKETAALNNLEVGDEFIINEQRFTLIGLYDSEQSFIDMMVVLPITTLQTLFDVDGFDRVTAYAENYGQVETVAEKLRELVEAEGFEVIAQDAFFQTTIDSLAMTQRAISVGLLASAGVAVIVIIFAVILIVRERGTEIGILKAVGASSWQVIRQFWVEVTAMSGIAAVLAVVFLLWLGPVITSLFQLSSSPSNMPGPGGGGPVMIVAPGGPMGNLDQLQLESVTLNAQTFLIILALGVGLAMLSSLIPAWYVARLRPAEVLRRINL